MNLDKAKSIYEKFKSFDDNFVLAGSARRQKQEDLHDVDLVYLGEEIPEIPFSEGYIQKGKSKVAVTVEGEQVDIYKCTEEHYGAMLFFLTGPGFFNVRMRRKAKKLGMKLNQYGLFKEDGSLVASKTEEEMFESLGYKYIEPYKRA